MKEFLSSLFIAIRERIKNPFLGFFILSWIGFNWKIFAFMIYGQPNYSTFISQVENQGFWCLFGFPFLMTVIFIIVNPWIGIVVQYIRSKPYEQSHMKSLELEKRLEQKRAEIKLISERESLEFYKEKTKAENEVEEERNQNKIDSIIAKLDEDRRSLNEAEERLEERFTELHDKERLADKKLQQIEKDENDLLERSKNIEANLFNDIKKENSFLVNKMNVENEALKNEVITLESLFVNQKIDSSEFTMRLLNKFEAYKKLTNELSNLFAKIDGKPKSLIALDKSSK